MSVQNAYNAYKQNSVTTASPGELTLMLYNGCIKFIHQAKKAIEVKNSILQCVTFKEQAINEKIKEKVILTE